MTQFLRGHRIRRREDDRWVYVDTGELTAETWQTRPCGHCQLPNRADDHDACLGELPGVMNACCGHGEPHRAYIQWPDRTCTRGEEAFDLLQGLKEVS